MPDDNKFQKLREIEYTITPACVFCIHGDFPSTSIWGKCRKHRYQHLKHDNPDEGRGVSIITTGTCPDVELDPGWVSQFGAHQEFLETT